MASVGVEINPRLIDAKYAVRGPILDIANDIKAKLNDPASNLPFDELIYCNIGNPQSLGQPPITFYRQVLAGVLYPDIFSHLPLNSDVKERVASILKEAGGQSIGAYTHSQGLKVIRKHIAEFIEERDGFPSNPDRIFLTNGASQGVANLMQTFIFKENHGVLIPIPQYPLYTATLALVGGKAVPYELIEKESWKLSVENIEEAIKKAKEEGIEVKAMVVINPGNPTGNCASEEELTAIVKLCEKYNIMLLADEVYQINIYKPDMKFTSINKIVKTLGAKLPLVNFHSTSKGLIGECGLRGGYFELVNFSDEVYQQLYKLASISLCPNTVGQVAADLMVKGPKKGDPSYPLFKKEREIIFRNLREKSVMVSEGLNKIDGIDCQNVDGALYAFPTIKLPKRVVDAAEKEGLKADAFYCMELLKNTGIVTVPGSGFRQVAGTYHFRMTILPPKDKIPSMLQRMGNFHRQFTQELEKTEL